MAKIETLEALEELYGLPAEASIGKVSPRLTAAYRQWLERAPFFAIASVSEDNLDCSPRGDKVGHVCRMMSETQIAIPDRRGNNRIDTLRNIVRDPRVSLLFMIPGIKETLRVKGKAQITTDTDMINMFEMDGKKPVTVILVDIAEVYFQCARALKRSALWDAATQATKDEVPSAGQMTKSALPEFDDESYDSALDTRQNATLY